MIDPPAYFKTDAGSRPEVLVPQEPAISGWTGVSMRGPAVSGALARAVERVQLARGRDDLRPARWTVDLCRPAPMQPFTVKAHVLQEGRRLLLVSAELDHDGVPGARATGLFLKPTEDPANPAWRSSRTWDPPPDDLVPPAEEPSLFASDCAGWSADQAAVQDASRKRAWHRPIPVVEGEPVTSFQAVAGIADLASLVTHWGAEGIAHINADITLALARMPVSLEVGLGAVDRVEHEGIAIGTAAMFDRRGTIGTVVISALANAGRAIDLRTRTRLGQLR